MAIGAGTVWRVRKSGSNQNGGGFDSTIASAGTDFSQADAAALSLTDLTSTASTTITSVTGGFTAAMIGNALRLNSGAGTTVGHYFVKTRVDTNTITVDRASGTYTAGVGRVGGGVSTLARVFNGVAVAGNTIYVQGSGTDTPTTDDYTATGSYIPSLGTDLLPVKVVSENGRARLSSDGAMFISALTFVRMEGLYLAATDVTNGNLGVLYVGEGSTIRNCIVNTGNGESVTGIRCDGDGTMVDDCYVFGTTGTPVASASTDTCGIALFNNLVPSIVTNCTVRGCRGHGILGFFGHIHHNIVYKNAVDGIQIYGFNSSYPVMIEYNTINANLGHGVYVDDDNFMYQTVIRNNIISNQAVAAKYGIKVATGTVAANDRAKRHIDYNVLFGNTANYSGISAGTHDTQGTDPGYTDAATLDFSTAIAMSGLGWPGLYRGSGTTSYPYPGVWQSSGGDDLNEIFRRLIELEHRLHLYQQRVTRLPLQNEQR